MIDRIDYIDRIEKAIRAVIGEGSKDLHAPVFDNLEKEYLNKCIDTTFVSSVGKFVDQFELELANYTGVKRAVAVVNGTCALHIALKLSGVSENDEVIIPSMTFVATANSVRHAGGVPHFVDIENRTLGIDPAFLNEHLRTVSKITLNGCINKYTGNRIKAIMPMHAFGHPCDMEALMRVAHDYNLEVIEDAAEALGSFYFGKHVGGFGKCGILSFNGNKIITTGGGGAIITNDEVFADHVKHITTTAKIPHKWKFMHDDVGYNYRMPNLNAALGCAQLNKLEGFLSSKRKLFNLYSKTLEEFKQIRLFHEPKNCKSNYWLQTLILDESLIDMKETFIEITNNNNLITRPAWDLIHSLKPYEGFPRSSLRSSQDIESRLINIPSGANLI